ncbi:hypothetical protein BM531_21440, partial [Clostridioides difficile]
MKELSKYAIRRINGYTRIDQKLIFKDYNKENTEIKELMKKVKNLNSEELIELVNMAKLLGYSGFQKVWI